MKHHIWVRSVKKRLETFQAWKERVKLQTGGNGLYGILTFNGLAPYWGYGASKKAALWGSDAIPWYWPIASLTEIETFLDREVITQTSIGLDIEGNGNGWGPNGVNVSDTLARGLASKGVKKVYLTFVLPFHGKMRKQDAALFKAFKALGVEVVLVPQAYSKNDPKLKWDDHPHFRVGVIQHHNWEHLKEEGVEVQLGMMVAFQEKAGDIRKAQESTPCKIFWWWVDNHFTPSKKKELL